MVIHTDLDVPGTTALLVNDGEIANLGLNLKKQKNVILIPQPAEDPNDPLNWTVFRKNLHFGTLFIYGLLMGAASSWGSTLFSIFLPEFHTTYKKVTMAGGLKFLFIAIGCVAAQPVANKFGRRPVYLFTTLVALLASLAFLKKSFNGLLANSILSGFAVSPMDSLIQVSVGDIFFLDQHGLYIGLYSLSLGVGSTMGPLISGFVASGLPTWEWCNYILIILFGSLFLFEFFFLEESYYYRSNSSHENELLGLTVSKSPPQENAFKVRAYDSNDPAENKLKNKDVTTSVAPAPKTYIQRLKPFIVTSNPSHFYDLTIMPLKTFRYPAIIWAGFSYGLCVCWLSLISFSLSEFYAAPPYLFSSSALGLLNLAGVVGTVVAAIFMPLSDMCQVYFARKNNGISESEFRLRLYWFPTIVNTLGIFLWGFSPYFDLHWMGGACGLAFIMFGIAATTSLGLTYVMECYPKQIPQTMAAILFIRNILGMIFTFVFQYWYEGMGVLHQTIMLGVFCFFVNMLFLVFITFGKDIRQYTKHWYFSKTEGI